MSRVPPVDFRRESRSTAELVEAVPVSALTTTLPAPVTVPSISTREPLVSSVAPAPASIEPTLATWIVPLTAVPTATAPPVVTAPLKVTSVALSIARLATSASLTLTVVPARTVRAFPASGPSATLVPPLVLMSTVVDEDPEIGARLEIRKPNSSFCTVGDLRRLSVDFRRLRPDVGGVEVRAAPHRTHITPLIRGNGISPFP